MTRPVQSRTPPPGFFREARRIIKLDSVKGMLVGIANEVATKAGPGHGVKAEVYGDRVSVEIGTYSTTAKINEARDKTLTKAFAAARTEPRRR